jgi:uncharacterized protein YcbK (DUF882 family)
MNRRGVLKFAGSALLNGALVAGGASVLLAPERAFATAPTPAAAASARQIALINTHTGDAFRDAYWERGAYVPGAMDAIKHVMRDHRSNEVHDIDPRLLDELHQLNGLVGAAQPYQIISGYRSPTTNAALHANSDGVATHSLHMEGRAIDIRMGGVDLTRLHDAALSMNSGGVGFYPSSDFIHVDTGRVRRW